MMRAADREEPEPPHAPPPERSSLDLAERDAHVRRLCAARQARLADDDSEHDVCPVAWAGSL